MSTFQLIVSDTSVLCDAMESVDSLSVIYVVDGVKHTKNLPLDSKDLISGYIRSFELTDDTGKTVNLKLSSTDTVAAKGKIYIDRCQDQGYQVRYQGSNGTTKFQRLDAFKPLKSHLLGGSQDAQLPDNDYEMSQDADRSTFDAMGQMDEWIRAAGAALSKIPEQDLRHDTGITFPVGLPGSFSDMAIWSFWLNDVQLVNNRHRGNDMENRSSPGARTRRLRVVAARNPTLTGSSTNKQRGIPTEQTWTNDTSSDQTYDISYSETKGTTSEIATTSSSSISVSASLSIGSFGVNASGSINNSSTNTSSQSDVVTDTVSHKLTVKSRTKLLLRTTITQTNTEYAYVVPIVVRARYNEPGVYVDTRSGASKPESWVDLADFGEPISDRITSETRFLLKVGAVSTDVEYQEIPL